jgi:hypothetical protein
MAASSSAVGRRKREVENLVRAAQVQAAGITAPPSPGCPRCGGALAVGKVAPTGMPVLRCLQGGCGYERAADRP